MQETIAKLLATIQTQTQAVLATTKTHKWWWAGGGGATVVAVVVAIVMFGGFLGPSGKAICTAALDHARNYGVIPYTAALANSTAKSTDVKNRSICTAQAGDDTFNLTVDVKCTDKEKSSGKIKDECIALYSVARPDGLTTYQVRQVPPDDNETASIGGDAAAGGSNPGAPTGVSDASSDMAVDNAAAAPGGVGASAPAAQPAQPAPDANTTPDNPQ